MDIIQAIVYGIVQGLTEFLPISSSGHLFLVPALLGWEDAGSGFTAVIQLGTLAAVLIFFWGDLTRILSGWTAGLARREKRDTPEYRIGWSVVWGTIPIIIAGLALRDLIDNQFRSPWVVASTLIIFGLLLGLAEKVGRRSQSLEAIGPKEGLIVGLWQCLALIPGSSRSGSTITGALFLGIDRESAARYSFLLSIPSVLLSGLYKLYDAREQLMDEGLWATVTATAVSFVVGWAAIAFLMKWLQTRSTSVFVWYRIALGLVIFGLLFAGVLR
ncbi:MAG: undecaprenyl-diphosphate phosphatase [Fimbriimonadaceae bacterium]|nr:undecaprenyl-diphosphate phosphatase [Fimbriimonadaceae bacterium]